MLFTLAEIAIEVAMILATIAALICFITLIVYVVLERRELRRLRRGGAAGMTTVVQRTRSPRVAAARGRTVSHAGTH